MPLGDQEVFNALRIAEVVKAVCIPNNSAACAKRQQAMPGLQPPLQYLTLSGDNGGSQPDLGVITQTAVGMV